MKVDIDMALSAAVNKTQVPFVVAMVGNSRDILYSNGYGDYGSWDRAEDTVFRIFSMTKAVGSLAAIILIDRGLLGMHMPVARYLPEWNDVRVIAGWDGDQPILREPRREATICNLATHTSGLEYELWSDDIQKYLEVTGHPSILSGTVESLNYPLTRDPNTRWAYGIGIDWLTRVVEKVDGRPIDVFCQEEIFGPLGMTETGFEPDQVPAKLAQVYARTEDGGFTPMDIAPPPNPEFYGMGHALYSTAADYMKFLQMILNHGTLNGSTIISTNACKLMRENQLPATNPPLTFRKMVSVAPALTDDFDPFPEAQLTHTFAFLRNEDAIADRRSEESLSWAGVCNTHYWIDPKEDLCAVIMTQLLPFVEPGFMQTYADFEKAVYYTYRGRKI
ncbi:MAG: serine hydrolase [Aestuariivita sp.]|nr:serine hydrolase [Aestuariivita sp.]MCY4203717.1 serine hydrolase [Aestuariivita sp.]MCY4289095.1 serine hydrolase [Aestuariivita sp.]MCY4347695.1 serine hydrolase [Aestuariivita sp.]